MKPRHSAMIAALAAIALAPPAPAAAQVIAGRVVDAATGAGVARARVTVAGHENDESSRTLTAADGRFSIAVRGGLYRVRAEGTGYEAARTSVTAGPGDTVRVVLRIPVAPRRLGAVTASTRPRRLPMVGVFTPVYPTDSLLAAERTRGEGGPARVIVRGVVPTPTACWRLAGAADRVGPLVTLNIQARPTGDPCPSDAVGASTYKVTLRRLPPGTYTLRVLHTYRAGAWQPSVALDSAGVTVR
ncbi:MAG TPA: carboxypeptidase-like regulatory domain-containing protein [Longimicrobium sp.]|nr:carboxypeptidase-like regulatory domain-containing protein [Longimicrobium sp.]